MDSERFQAIVARLEGESARSPAAYRAKVGALVALGFVILALLLTLAGFGLALIVGAAAAIALTGGAALILLLKFGKLLLFLAIPLWYLIVASVRALFVRVPAPQGRAITRAEAPALFAAIDEMRTRMRGPRFHEVLIVDEVNAAVAQRPAFGLFGFPRNYLLLGLPLLESLPPEEALAVVAHEYGHLSGAHGHFGAFVYRLRNAWGTVLAYLGEVQGWLGRLVVPLVRWYVPYFNAYTFVLARANEFEADAASAELVGAQHAARALKRVNIVAPRHDGFMNSTFERISAEATPPNDLLHRWAECAVSLPAEGEAERWLAEALDREGHFTDTHPTLRARLSALLPQDSTLLPEPPPAFVGTSAAVSWLGPVLERVRADLQSNWLDRVAEPWAERHAEHQRQRARCEALRQELEDDPARDATLGLELLQLRRELEPRADLREEFARYNAAFADCAPALYIEGSLRLAHDDAEGIALLERAFAIDPEATKPAIEHIHRFLLQRKDKEAAARYEAQWQARDAFEAQREQELRVFDAAHALVTPDPPADEFDTVRTYVARAGLSNVSAVYFARRVLPCDPGVRTYVLCVRVSWWGRRLGRQQAIVDRLAAIEWPVHLFVLSLDGQYGKLTKRLQAIPGSRLLP